jgi:gamma-glutamyltranspeptidase/glutathione hydrolase
MVEKEFPEATRQALEKMGYKVVNRGAIGRSELIKIDGKKIEAVGDNRGDDTAIGY